MMTMSLQLLVVALLVVGSAAYTAWTLMPSGWRRVLAGRMLMALPWLPPKLTARLRQASQANSGCGCDGCDHAPAKKAPPTRPEASPSPGAGRARPAVAAQPITFHHRVRR